MGLNQSEYDKALFETRGLDPVGAMRRARSEAAKRKCLRCLKMFDSESPGNRICKNCKKKRIS